MRLRSAVAIPVMVTMAGALLAAPAATAAPVARTAPATSSPMSLSAARVMETARGTARTLSLPGGGYLVVHEFGDVSVADAAGRTVWNRDTQSFYQDWGLTWQHPGFTVTPQVPWGGNVYDPLEFTGPGYGVVNNLTPYAAGDLGGSDDVAVAEVVGWNISSLSGCHCTWPFSVPGSSLHLGTFVTVLDARTGRTVYHELVPGYVTQLAIAGGRLIVGDETGDPQTANGIGEWGSVTTLTALELSPSGTATQAWQYSTAVPWARLLSIAPAGNDQLAAGWSDTPPDLGTPRPPDGHVLLFDARTGTVKWRVRTPGYPVLMTADQSRAELAVVQLTDPTDTIGYTLTGLRLGDGSTALSVPESGALPMALGAGSGRWAVSAENVTVPAGGSGFDPQDGRVTVTDPASGTDVWTTTLPKSGLLIPFPDGLVIAGDSLTVGSWLGNPPPSVSSPLQAVDTLSSFDLQTGRGAWSETGDPGDPLSLSVAGGSEIRAVSSHQDVLTYAASGVVLSRVAGAGPGDLLSGVALPSGPSGGTDLVAGDEDGDVYAFAGKALSRGIADVLWRALLPGPVHQIVTAVLDGRVVLVAAATSAVAVLDARSGRVLTLIPVPGTYAYTATVIAGPGGGPAVVVPGTSLTAYSMTSGQRLWQYAAPSGASFSDAAYADGVVAAEYSNAGKGFPVNKPATEMAAVGLAAATGTVRWTEPVTGSALLSGQLWNGVATSPVIAGVPSGEQGVAFAWQTLRGQGQVDVRDIGSGALLYSDTQDDLSNHTQYLADPGAGLIAVGLAGSVLLGPGGGKTGDAAPGTTGAIAATPGGTQAMLFADAATAAFGPSVFDGASSPLAQDETYNAGTLISGDFAGDGSEQVAALPADWLAYQVVGSQAGLSVQPYLETIQHGLALLTLSGSGSGSPSQAPASMRPPVPGSTAISQAPAGEIGSTAPDPEPVRSGAAQPGAGQPGNAQLDAAVSGYTPSQIRAYLGLTGTGAGQTIAIVDAYDDSSIVSDTETFSTQFGLPGVCGSGGNAGNCFTLDVTQQNASVGTNSGWALETSLDVEWAHAIAPRATIVLESAADATFASMFRGVAAAAALHPAAVSMSWGENEFSDETYYDHFCAVSTTVCLVSAGDDGHPGSYPAYNPAVVAVGGTALTLAPDGSVSSEQTWADSGGGRSFVEPEPSYQDGVQHRRYREMPDIAFDASLSTGVAVYDSVPDQGQSGWLEVGGTSVGAPSWSGILADADQLRAAKGEPPLTAAGYATQRTLYSLAAGGSSVLAPVTTGPDNGFCPVGCAPGPGYDEITGVGSPRSGIDAALAASPSPSVSG